MFATAGGTRNPGGGGAALPRAAKSLPFANLWMDMFKAGGDQYGYRRLPAQRRGTRARRMSNRQ
ncbi:hypothetical protein CAF53_11755 [Sphingobium sp. LB126]|nr:hypothetical protein CAF53_11755 [Sphingobium sp. LB126]